MERYEKKIHSGLSLELLPPPDISVMRHTQQPHQHHKVMESFCERKEGKWDKEEKGSRGSFHKVLAFKD
jgi:hypothetical protein